MSAVAAIVIVAFGLVLIAFTGVVFTKPAIGAILDAFRELSANALRRADFSLADRRGTRRALAGDVAIDHLLARRMGNRRELRSIDAISVAVAPSVRGADTTDIHALPYALRSGVFGIQRVSTLRGLRWWRPRVLDARSSSSTLSVWPA